MWRYGPGSITNRHRKREINQGFLGDESRPFPHPSGIKGKSSAPGDKPEGQTATPAADIRDNLPMKPEENHKGAGIVS